MSLVHSEQWMKMGVNVTYQLLKYLVGISTMLTCYCYLQVCHHID